MAGTGGSDMVAVLAIDLGGTKVEAAIVQDDGVVLAQSRSRRPTGRDITPDELRAAFRDVMAEAIQHAPDVAAIGVGAAGPFALGGVEISPLNMPRVHGVALRDEVAALAEQLLGRAVPTALGHDGGALALAESWLGATRDSSSSMSMVVSTGVGGGIVVNGVLLTGASANAGHIGQTYVRGEDATLEELAAGPASVRWAQAQGWQGASGEELARDAAANDAIAREAIVRSATFVGRGIVDAVTLLDLDVVAIGGGFSHASEDYVDIVQAEMRRIAPLASGRATRVVRSALEGQGPLIGAAALALRAL